MTPVDQRVVPMGLFSRSTRYLYFFFLAPDLGYLAAILTATLRPPLILAAHYNFLFEKNVRSGDLTDTKQQNSGREKPRERERKKERKRKPFLGGYMYLLTYMHMVSSFTRKSEKFLGERKISCDEHQMEGRAWVIERLASKVIAFGVVVGVFFDIYLLCILGFSKR